MENVKPDGGNKKLNLDDSGNRAFDAKKLICKTGL